MTVTDDPEHRYRGALDRLEKADIPESDKDLIREFLDAIDENVSTVNFRNEHGQRETKAYSTLHNYCQALKRVCELSERSLTSFDDVNEINRLFDEFQRGSHPNVKDDGYGKGTLTQWQSAVTKFYEYHTDLGMAHDEIVVKAQDDSKVDDRDMFSREEVQAMRDAVDNPRDRCILELLLNTGQRIRAIQTLRVKDVDTEEGIYYLNTDEYGLKGADKNGKKRPLLGAKRAVYDWLKDHQGEPDDYLITSLPSANRGNHGEKLSQSNIRRRLKIVADEAGIDKPPNPHNFRHYFVTVCKRDYNMDDATIKHLIGHHPGSNIMETTYQHLNDDDHIESAEVAAGLREEEQESPLTPKVCPTCSEPLDPSDVACSACGTVFGPNAKTAHDEIQEDMKEGYKQTDPDDDETMEELEAIEQALDDPEVKQLLLEKLADE